jgi:hypothetical protein
MAYGEGHSEHSQTKGQSYAKKADTDIWKCGRYYGASATAKNQPKSPKEFCAILFHDFLLCFLMVEKTIILLRHVKRNGKSFRVKRY